MGATYLAKTLSNQKWQRKRNCCRNILFCNPHRLCGEIQINQTFQSAQGKSRKSMIRVLSASDQRKVVFVVLTRLTESIAAYLLFYLSSSFCGGDALNDSKLMFGEFWFCLSLCS